MHAAEQAARTVQAVTVFNNPNPLVGRVTSHDLDRWVFRVEKAHGNHKHHLHYSGVGKSPWWDWL
jgi:hypothetical protein